MDSSSSEHSTMAISPTTHPAIQIQPSPSIRRKPRNTYKSPSMGESYPIGPFLFTTVSQKFASSSSSSSSSAESVKASTTQVQITTSTILPKRKKFPMGPPLPLYHPLGRLALSLPPLDPASVGLPTPVRSDDAGRRSSARARRPVAKLRDVEEESPILASVAPVVEVEIRDKPSPRKRRAGGGGVSKRKRKEVDDGDATYPAKRTRIPRGATNQNQAGDEESPTESVMPVVEVTPTPEPISEAPEDKKPERRSTRARGSAKRRDSSASEAASSVSLGPGMGSIKEMDSMEVDKTPDVGPSSPLNGGRTEEKEDGELSEESQSNHQPDHKS